MIEGVIITPLKQIIDDRGKVMHMLREDSAIFSKFGEIYFSCIYPGAIKAWKQHKEMTLNCAGIYGTIKFVLFDSRPESKTQGQVQEFILSPDNYFLLTIPPMIWTGFRGLGEQISILANCANIMHNQEESLRIEPFDKSIPYKWDNIC